MTDERSLVERAVYGDDEARELLAARYRPEAYRVAVAVLGEEAAAEDIAQDAMVRFQASLAGFRAEAELGTWLYRVTLNLCKDRLRRRNRRGGSVTLDAAVNEPRLQVDATGDDDLDVERASRAIRAAIGRLPEDQREAVTLRFFSGLSYAEIARATATAEGTVASRIFRALEKLGADLESKHLEVLR